MFYRKDLFDKHNLQAPKSWSDVVSAGKTIKSKEGIGGLACYYGSDGNRQNLFIWLNFLWAAGADVFDNQMKPAWTTSAGLKATRDYIDLHTKHGICGEGAVSNVVSQQIDSTRMRDATGRTRRTSLSRLRVDTVGRHRPTDRDDG